MRTISTALVVAACSIGSLAVAGGCTHETEGERTMHQADDIQSAAVKIKQGEDMIADGKADIAKGREIRTQGDTARGDRMVNDGEAKVRQGEALRDQGRKMRDEAKM